MHLPQLDDEQPLWQARGVRVLTIGGRWCQSNGPECAVNNDLQKQAEQMR